MFVEHVLVFVANNFQLSTTSLANANMASDAPLALCSSRNSAVWTSFATDLLKDKGVSWGSSCAALGTVVAIAVVVIVVVVVVVVFFLTAKKFESLLLLRLLKRSSGRIGAVAVLHLLLSANVAIVCSVNSPRPSGLVFLEQRTWCDLLGIGCDGRNFLVLCALQISLSSSELKATVPCRVS